MTWSRSMFQFIFHDDLLIIKSSCAKNSHPIEHPIQTTPMVDDDQHIVIVIQFVTFHHKLNTMDQF